jgi:tetratricopeptide (TPR) repeat protein
MEAFQFVNVMNEVRMSRVKSALVLLLFATCTSLPALAGPCSSIEPQLALASRQLILDQPSAAERILLQLASSHPDCPEILLAQARLQAAKGAAAEAANLFLRYTDLAPEDSRGFAYFGRLFLEQRDYQKADALSVAAVDRNPRDPAALALRGQILVMKGQLQEGKSLLEKACQLDPSDPEAQFQLGAIYDHSKRTADAVTHFRKAVALNPRDARAWDYLALNLEPLEQIDAAEQAYRKGLEVNQKGQYFDAFLDYNYGRFLAKRNQLAESKQHLDRAVELIPQIRAVWYERAKLNLQLKNYQQARSDAEKAASCEDRAGIIIDLQIYALLNQAYARLGETALARKYAELSRETAPPVRGERR